MSTPRKPESAFKKSVRAVEVGIALGVVCFILNALLAGEIAGQMFQAEDESLVLQLLLLLLPAFLLAPATAFAAGLLIEGERWRVVVSQNLTLQLTILLVPMVSMGASEVFSVRVVLIELGLLAAGIVLSGLAMGRAQQRKPAPEPEKKPNSLAAIDFEKVKQQAAQASAQPATPSVPSSPAPDAAAAAQAATAAPASPQPVPADPAVAGPADDAKPKA